METQRKNALDCQTRAKISTSRSLFSRHTIRIQGFPGPTRTLKSFTRSPESCEHKVQDFIYYQCISWGFDVLIRVQDGLWKRMGQAEKVQENCIRKWRWIGERIENTNRNPQGKRSGGRPRGKWRGNVKNDMKILQLSENIMERQAEVRDC